MDAMRLHGFWIYTIIPINTLASIFVNNFLGNNIQRAAFQQSSA